MSALLSLIDLPLPSDKCQVTYVWIDGSGINLRAKSRTLMCIPKTVADIPNWNFDGSSTGQATAENSDVILKPVSMYKDPFRTGDNKIVLCATYTPDGEPHSSNHRDGCLENMIKAKDEHPWFGMEQEFILKETDGKVLGWPKTGFPAPQGPYYCGVGPTKAFGRDIIEAHYRVCLYCGIKISGTNAEVMPGQWEFQIGPSEGIEIGDDMWMARYLLQRVAEGFNAVVSFDPKPVMGDWNGSGMHCNFSTVKMREDNGIAEIHTAIDKLSKTHKRHLECYGDNSLRLTGTHETSSVDEFTFGVGSRGCSIRIPAACALDKKGYFEDRRPSSDSDPYLVSNALVKTCCLNE